MRRNGILTSLWGLFLLYFSLAARFTEFFFYIFRLEELFNI